MKQYRVGPTTERLKHREMTLDDTEAVFALSSHPEVMRYTEETPLASLKEAKDRIAYYPDFDTVGFGRWGCYLKGTRTLIGFCGFKYLDDLKEVDLGYRFFPEYWGQGIATEAGRACIQFGFEVIGLENIIGLVVPKNLASIRVLEKVRMQFDGDIEIDGIKALKYSIDRSQFEARYRE